MTQKNLFFSVIIPVFERHHLLKRALQSVISQTYDHTLFECIVIDDGSTTPYFQETQFVLENISFSYHHFYQNQGVSSARNYGIKQAKGNWLAFLDSDDEWMPEKLAESFKFIQSHQDASDSLNNFKIFQTKDFWVRNGKSVNIPLKYQKKAIKNQADKLKNFTRCLEHCFISVSSLVVHHSVFEQGYLFDSKLKTSEDYELWLRLSHVFSIHLLPTPLTIRHQAEKSQNQLSFQYPLIDRFRLYALQKFMGSKIKPSLTKHQYTLVKQTIKKKATILYQGAIKRKKYGYALIILSLYLIWKTTKLVSFKRLI